MPTGTRMRAQSAMEYLMTYGWSILIIAVVLGALFGLGVFNGAASLGSGCLAQSGFLCQQAVLRTNGSLSISLGQVSQQQLTLVAVGCSNTDAEPSFTTISPTVKLVNGQTASGVVFQCPIPSNTIGSSFTGTLWIEYTVPQYPGVTVPVELGTISTKVASTGTGGVRSGSTLSSTTTMLSSTTTMTPGSLSCGTPPVTGQTIYIDVNSTMDVGILNDVNTTICQIPRRGPIPAYASPITYSWSTTGSCPGWSNPGNVDNYTYTPSAASSTCNIDLSVTDTSGDSGSGTSSVTILSPPLILASGQNFPTQIAVSGGMVYYAAAGNGSILSVPVGGGPITVLASGQGTAGLATDGTYLYWTSDSQILKESVNGPLNSYTVLANGQNNPLDIATDGTNVYWVDENSGYVEEESINGPLNSNVTLANGQSDPYEIATDGTNVYWGDCGSGNIEQESVNGPLNSGMTLATETAECPGDIYTIATDGRNVYYGSFYGPEGGFQVPVGGGSTTQIIASGTPVGSMATDGTNVYWSEYSSGGTIEVTPVGGGNSIILAANQDGSFAVAIDPSNVYWTDDYVGTVDQIAK